MTRELLALLDEAFNRRSWHGANLRGSIRGLDLKTLARRPKRGRHNIWELVVHAAYWKYAVRRKLTGEKRGAFALAGSDFWKRPDEGGIKEWQRDVALLEAEHKALRAAVESFPKAHWSRRAPGKNFSYAAIVRGVAAHDLYHAGQIQLLKRF